MKAFRYARPDGAVAAVQAVAADPAAKFLGGGTNLVDLMKLGVERPDLLVDVTRLPFGDVDVDPDGTVRIGTNVRNGELAAHPAVRTGLPVLSQALLAVPPVSCGTWRRSAATCSSAPVASTSRT